MVWYLVWIAEMPGHESLAAGVEVVHEHHTVVTETLAGEHLQIQR